MKQRLVYILIFTMGLSLAARSQTVKESLLSKLNTASANVPDSALYSVGDSTQVDAARTKAFRLTAQLGERYRVPMDTLRLNFANNTLIDGRSLAVGYLGNIGSPAQSRIFAERDDNNDFIYANGYGYYITTPTNALFYDVKDPYTHITYLRAGGQKDREEAFNGVLTTNIGKPINIGVEFDYTYVRGQYASNANKMLYYRPFVSYLSDKYEMHAYFRNHNYLNTENGGLVNDRYVSHPDEFADAKNRIDRQSFPTRYNNTWNRIKGQQIFLSHRYNLGFYRELPQAGNLNATIDSTAIMDTVFTPVSSIIHTLEYENNSRRFISNNAGIDTCYNQLYGSPDSTLDDNAKAWNIKNVIGLSLREGFQDWVKFGLTAWLNIEKRQFTVPSDSMRSTTVYDEFSSYIGGELSKRQGKLLTYVAKGEFCFAGSDIGEFHLDGKLSARFPLLGKEAHITASGYIKNQTPAFYLRHHHSRYFLWDLDLKKIQRIYACGEIDLKQTLTKLTAGVENISNFVYFSQQGTPEQYGKQLQIVTARLKQDIRYQAFGWENEAVYQLSSDNSVLPLPQLCAYSNIYLDFTYSKVLHIQLGADARYFTSYYAPYYEPATQQFQLQSEKKIGNYPIINAYANLKLKQARFFIAGYNIGSLFITPTDYFSLLHYPLNPMLIKVGISVQFTN